MTWFALMAWWERYVDHAFGDSAGWHFAENANHIFLKPKAEHADSNLILITDRRVYYFELRYSDARRNGTKVFGVSFIYPETPAARADADIERERTREGFEAPRSINANYTMTGRQSLAPVNAWDNQQFTFFRFPGTADVPAIFMVNPDGSESIVNMLKARPAILRWFTRSPRNGYCGWVGMPFRSGRCEQYFQNGIA